jgi:prevent-host-death family protein
MDIDEARAALSTLVEKAAKGEFVTITRDGIPVAVLVSVSAAAAVKKTASRLRPNLPDYLLTFPGGFDERSRTGD